MGIKFKLDVTLTKIKGATIQAGKDGRRWLCLDDPAVFYKDKNGDIKLDLVCFEKQSQYSSGFVKRSRRKEEPQSNDDPILGNYKTFGSEGSAAPSNRPAFE
jgi:hypothetical protein